MAATLAKGDTVIENAAREPEVVDLADCLDQDGRQDRGRGHVRRSWSTASRGLHGATHEVLPDRIETGTYAMAVAMAGGDVRAREHARRNCCRAPSTCSAAAGAEVTRDQCRHPRAPQRQRHRGRRHHDRAVPGLPDRSAGAVHGADDAREGHLAHPRDDLREPLHARAGTGAPRRPRSAWTATAPSWRASSGCKGAPVMATDLRASVSLVIAGLAAEGETPINRVYHLDRGFEALEAKLSAAAAPRSSG